MLKGRKIMIRNNLKIYKNDIDMFFRNNLLFE